MDYNELARIPPSVLGTLPALMPPPGVQSNFTDPEDKGYMLMIVSTFLFCLATCFFLSRIYTKAFIIRKASWDDLTCTTGFLGAIALYICAIWFVTKTPLGQHMWDVKLVDFLTNDVLIPIYLIIFLPPVTLLSVKMTFFLLYYQIFRPLRWIRISVWVGAILTCAFYGATAVAQIVFATPRPNETWLSHTLNGHRKVIILSVPSASVGLAVDVYLLAAPIIAVFGLQLPKKRKIGVMCIFMFGLLACLGSVLNIYYRKLSAHSRDYTWYIQDLHLVNLVEINLGIVCACIPAFSKMLHHHLPPSDTLRSFATSAFASLRSSRFGDKSSGAASSQSGLPTQVATTDSDKSRNLIIQPTYELGQMKSVQTFIRTGQNKAASDDKIHLTHEIRQH